MQTSFSIRHDVVPNFGTVWHYHPELELHYTIKGQGVRFIGDNISNFSEGECILLGENLPHTWHCNEEYFKKDSDKNVEAVVLHFLPDCFGDTFLHLPETRFLQQLFVKAKRGMIILNETKKKLTPLLMEATKTDNLERLISLLSILKILAETDDYHPITNDHSFFRTDLQETERLNTICSYTLANYSRYISLNEIADLSSLTVTSFCRYFKFMTKKTYFDFLNEIRINNACRFLIEDKHSIQQISERCGFNNLANFYRQFKKVAGVTPQAYKRSYLKASYV